MLNKKKLYHIHRKGNLDDMWQVGNTIIVDDNFESCFHSKDCEDNQNIKKVFGEDYNIDHLISMTEKAIRENIGERIEIEDLKCFLKDLNFIRREQALEEGRKIYAPNAPSRTKSLFLTDRSNLLYWINQVGSNSYQEFLMELEGNLFISSDDFFPDSRYSLERQVEESKKYWQPKMKKITPHKEMLFQGRAKIIK